MSMRHRYLSAFHAADKDNNGELTRNELTTVLLTNNIPLSEIDTLMDKLDLNGDGIITLGEYKIALGISTQPLSAWRELFDELDKDRSGSIDFSELSEFLKSADMGSLIPTLRDWMMDYDVNGDGKLNYKEFLGFISTLE